MSRPTFAAPKLARWAAVWSRPRRARAEPSLVDGRIDVVAREELEHLREWRSAFADVRKDHRYYELVEDTIAQGFEYRYFVVRDAHGGVLAIQPFLLLDQDLLAGAGARVGALAGLVRRLWRRFLRLRTLMIGCAAGEGHLDGGPGGDEPRQRTSARLLASAVIGHARAFRASLIVLKEFPAKYRNTLECFSDHGFTRVPSLPMTRLDIDYASFEDYLERALSRKTRRDLRLKFRAAEQAAPIELEVRADVAPIVDELYALYLQVYGRSPMHFEKLTRTYFCEIGRRMPDKVRFFVWRQDGRTIAFSLCMIERDAIYAEYLGLDYTLALDLHLYHYAVRDVIRWGIANGFKSFCSSGLNYDPKLHMRHRLEPLDLYVRHASAPVNALLKWILPLIEPTRRDRTLRKFANFDELWGRV
ncbi:MAG TPA: GNAT family N-acetyltransferase [Xanthobacteraceae bacterium]